MTKRSAFHLGLLLGFIAGLSLGGTISVYWLDSYLKGKVIIPLSHSSMVARGI